MPYSDPVARKAARQAHYIKNRERYLAQAAAQRQTEDYKRKQPERSRRSMLQRRYGITLEQYQALWNAQHGRCLLCGTHDPKGNRKYLAVDHCHRTGKVRALLCATCNILVAYAEHPRLAAAQEYVKKYIEWDPT